MSFILIFLLNQIFHKVFLTKNKQIKYCMIILRKRTLVGRSCFE